MLLLGISADCLMVECAFRVSLGISKVCSMPRAASMINSPPSYKAEPKARGPAVRWEGDTDCVNAADVFKLCMVSLLGRCGFENNSAPVEAQLRLALNV